MVPPGVQPVRGTRDYVVQKCLSWMRYRVPEGRRRSSAAPKVAFMGEGAHSSAAERIGTFRPALREAQFYWAASSLENPMFAALAFAKRRMRFKKMVVVYLYENHRDDWMAWRESHPEFAYGSLVLATAEAMTDKLGQDIY